MNIMRQYWALCWLLVGYLLLAQSIRAQTNASVQTPTQLNRTKKPDSVQTTRSNSLTFTASTDQRFFFFNDTRNEAGRRVPVGVYGLRAGFIFPLHRPNPMVQNIRPVAFKAGAGFYFINQEIHRPGLLPNTSESTKRHLRIITLFYERYLLRRKAFQVTLPLEIGYGHSRYERLGGAEDELARGVFVPAGAGVAAAYRFPTLRWFRPLHWFGFNLLTGYRFILKRDIPQSQINYSGFYVSAGPSFILENLTADLKAWRQKRRAKRQ